MRNPVASPGSALRGRREFSLKGRDAFLGDRHGTIRDRPGGAARGRPAAAARVSANLSAMSAGRAWPMAMCCARRMRMPRSAAIDLARRRQRPACSRSTPATISQAAGIGTMGVPFAAQAAGRLADLRQAHPGLAERARALCRRAGRLCRRRDLGAGERRGRAHRDRLRDPALGRRPADAAKPGAPAVWDELPGQHLQLVRESATRRRPRPLSPRRRIIVKRAHIVISRVTHIASSRAARSACTTALRDRFTLYADRHYPHRARRAFAERHLQDPGEPHPRRRRRYRRRVRLERRDRRREHAGAVTPRASCGRPVKWIAERSEAFLSDDHAPRQRHRCRTGARQGRQFPRAARQDTRQSSAPTLSRIAICLPTFANLGTLAGVYRIAGGPCRGAGGLHQHERRPRPIAAPAGPRRAMSSRADRRRRARDGHRPVELRRRNLIPPSAMPFKTALGLQLRLRRFRSQHEEGAGATPIGTGFEARARRGEAARQAARHRRRQRDRERRGAAGRRDSPRSASTPAARVTFMTGSNNARPGPRDDVQDHPLATSSASTPTEISSSRATPTRSSSASAPSARAPR